MTGTEGIGVVGVAGPSCSGKTSLLAELERRRPSQIAALSLDEYDLYPLGSPAMEAELAHPTIENWEDPNLFDMEKFTADVARIANGQKVLLKTRSRESLARGETRRMFEPRRLTVVEGIFALREYRARKFMGLKLFIDIPMELMVERRLQNRENDGMPWSDPDYIKGPMVEGTKTYVLPQREYADVILSGEAPTEKLADTFMANTDWLLQ